MVFMTSTTDTAEVLLQTDRLGRVRMPAQTRGLILNKRNASNGYSIGCLRGMCLTVDREG